MHLVNPSEGAGSAAPKADGENGCEAARREHLETAAGKKMKFQYHSCFKSRTTYSSLASYACFHIIYKAGRLRHIFV